LPVSRTNAELPLFRLTCHRDAAEHPHLGRVIYTSDPGYALTTGRCIDIGKITAQSMRGLAGRAPYFANGAARTLREVVDYYDRRYTIELTEPEKQDLTHLLEAL
jgi:cytochrome c peroxidase